MKMFWRAAPIAAVFAVLSALHLSAAADDGPKLVNLDCNTAADEDDPHVSSSGAYLYYAGNAAKKFDLMVSKRATTGKWAAGKPVGSYIQTKADEHGCFLTPDGAFPQYLFVVTNKDENDKKGDNFDIYVTYREGATKDFAPPEAVNVVDTAEDEKDPWLTRDGKTLYFTRKTKKDGHRVFTATRKSAKGAQGFEEPAPVAELPPGFHHATLTPDGKSMYLQGPLDKGRWGLFVSAKGDKTWGTPEALDLLNDASGPTGDQSPCLSRDGVTLYFASDRDGGKGGLDLYSVPVADLKKK
jgi:Tol biopolymer transport system component